MSREKYERKSLFILLLLGLLGSPLIGQVALSPFSLDVEPTVSLPLSDTDIFSLGGGATLSGQFGMLTQHFMIGPILGYTLQPLATGADNLSLISLGGRASYSMSPFKEALNAGLYTPALVNLGHIEYLTGEYDQALEYYEKAQKLTPNSPAVLLAVARASHALENYGETKAAYAKLQTADPALAQQFAYLGLKGDESTRAADIAGINDVVVWGEQ